jgi:hypothetical protein
METHQQFGTMYSIDDKDAIIVLKDTPQSSVGAPCPMILATEHSLFLAYYLQNTPPDWDGTTVTLIDEQTVGEPVALVKFTQVRAHMFGPPNDEAFGGHPLAPRGLRPYSVNEVRDSSWIRRLERMNAVHPYHKPEHFSHLRHFVFAFHDTTFECIAGGFAISLQKGSVAAVIRSGFEEND